MSIKFASHPHTILYQYDHSLKWSHLVADHQCTSFGQLFCTPVESSRILKLTQSNPGRVFAVAAFVGVTYDWALTFGQEVELIWRQRWSLITAVYLGARYIGILSAGLYILLNVPTISLTDTQCFIVFVVWDWMVVVVFAMLWVIIITRLHAMYQGSRRILIFLIVTFPAVNIFTGVVTLMITLHVSAEELILSGTYQCQSNYAHDIPLLASITWILVTVWEVLALCLAVWIAVKYFRDLRQQSAGGIIEVLMKTYVVYFASFVAVSFFHLILGLSPKSLIDNFVDASIVSGLLQILEVVQMSVLGPRLILGVREYHAKLVADSDAATGMTSITFQERVHISIGSGV